MLKKLLLFLSFTSVCFSIKAQKIVKETIQIDTNFVTYNVIYKETITKGIFSKAIAVFADDTSQIAIEKNYTNNYQNGLYKAYYPSGGLMVKAVYANNKLHGEFTYFDKLGEVAIKGIYKEGVKHKYWAYRYLKCYGRYKDGKKSGKWKCLNTDGGKYITKYPNLYLTGIFDFVRIRNNNTSTPVNDNTPRDNNDSLSSDSNYKVAPIDTFYLSAITYLARNYYIRNRIKIQFTKTKKERKYYDKYFDYKRDLFLFSVSPTIIPLGLAPFLTESEKLTSDTINTQLTANIEKYKNGFSSHPVKTDLALFEYSTAPNSDMILYFSEVVDHMLRVDIVEFRGRSNETFEEIYHHTNARKYSILIYFNQIKDVKAVEYQQQKVE
ncbi:MAG: hypothetical protein OQJ96_10260 [Flavobacteriales bacterium]|nr:hypothetical protein [Flavobacteriales bacterium]MCW8938523.1 hypothetical protein [Flavobacteriales bacterium]MCW8940123.1 hypothetical protein [Flavobacteriales bacterium]MCW8990254.1 hypothetical protein [Flavobacteriales bacterium]MCW9020672.1 hypothetical protein [Flavobacteriales bacterium]